MADEQADTGWVASEETKEIPPEPVGSEQEAQSSAPPYKVKGMKTGQGQIPADLMGAKPR